MAWYLLWGRGWAVRLQQHGEVQRRDIRLFRLGRRERESGGRTSATHHTHGKHLWVRCAEALEVLVEQTDAIPEPNDGVAQASAVQGLVCLSVSTWIFVVVLGIFPQRRLHMVPVKVPPTVAMCLKPPCVSWCHPKKMQTTNG